MVKWNGIWFEIIVHLGYNSLGKVVYICVLSEVIRIIITKDFTLIMLSDTWGLNLTSLLCTDNKHQVFVSVTLIQVFSTKIYNFNSEGVLSI